MKKIGSRWIVNVTEPQSSPPKKSWRMKYTLTILIKIMKSVRITGNALLPKPKRKNRYLMWTLAYQYRGTGSIPVLSITSGLRCLWFSPLNPRCFCRLTAFLPSTKVNYPNSKETMTKKNYFINARGLIWFILMLYQKCSIYKSRASVSLTKYSVICKW